jgi:cytochrome o ubiquinol oxidase subunit 1
MYGGRVRFTVPVLWSIGFMVTFVIGGMTGVLMAVPLTDFQLHDSLFLIAHFHNVIIGGVLFGAIAGYNIVYWFSKAFGFRLNERWGKASFLVDGTGSTSSAAPCTSSSANRYFASWPPGAIV